MYDIKYIKENGICPWEQESFNSNTDFLTISIIAQEKLILVDFLTEFLQTIFYAYKKIMRWNTHGYMFEGGLMQRKKLIKALKSSLSEFTNVYIPDIFLKNIPCHVSELSMPFNMYHYDSITAGRYSLLIFSVDSDLSPQKVYEDVLDYVFGLDAKNLLDILTKMSPNIIGRAYEHPETHAVFQLIGHKKIIEHISHDIENNGIAESDRDTVATWL